MIVKFFFFFLFFYIYYMTNKLCHEHQNIVKSKQKQKKI